MAVMCFIAGSILGWVVAATALALGASFGTALLLFIIASLGFVAFTLFAACLRRSLAC